ncbi:MAG: hypothetical protein ACLUFH_00660 [Monoglobales bacterium]
MRWLLDLLFESIREMCSQFIVDMMDVASSMFTEILSCDLNLFEELFGVAGALYRNAVLPIAVMMVLMILAWQLFKSMFGKMGTSSEDPLELVFRSCICLFMIAFAKNIVNYILEIVGTPYEWVVGTEIEVESFSGFMTAAEAVVSALGVDSLTISLLLLILQFVVAWNYFKMLFILAERYVLLGVLSYTAPLAFATGGSKATNNILSTWSKMFGGQVLVVILDAWCMKMFFSAYGNLTASSAGFTKFFAATMCLIGFCKITAKLDSYMGSLGVNLGRIGGGLSGLGAMMMAGRLLNFGGSRTGTGKGTAGPMNFGSGKTIPIGNGSAGTGTAGFAGGAGMSGGFAVTAGSNIDMPGDSEKNFAAQGLDNGEVEAPDAAGADQSPFGFSQENMENENLPFGIPDDSDYTMPEEMESEGSGFQSTEEADYPTDQMVGGQVSDMAEAMGMGSSNEEADKDEPDGTISEALSDSAIGSGIGGLYDSAEPGVGAEASFGESTLDEGTAGGTAGVTAGGESITDAGGLASSEGTYGNDTVGSTVSGFRQGEEEAGKASSMQEINAGGFESGGYGAEDSGKTADGGIYRAERDGEPYLRYDAEQFEKPQGDFQTIHDNGKTYYEIPEQQKAPGVLPETSAVLEKDGSIRLEKTYREVPLQNTVGDVQRIGPKRDQKEGNTRRKVIRKPRIRRRKGKGE